jgi:hypothetical protein
VRGDSGMSAVVWITSQVPRVRNTRKGPSVYGQLVFSCETARGLIFLSDIG